MRKLILMVGCLLLFTASFKHSDAEEPNTSANWVIPGCHAFIGQSGDPMRANACAGMVWGVLDIAGIAKWVCAPSTSTVGQAVRVVVQYIDARPARMHERFTFLALEALRGGWPCPNMQ